MSNSRKRGSVTSAIGRHARSGSRRNKLLAAVASAESRQILHLGFHSGEAYRYFLFPDEQYHELISNCQLGL